MSFFSHPKYFTMSNQPEIWEKAVYEQSMSLENIIVGTCIMHGAKHFNAARKFVPDEFIQGSICAAVWQAMHLLDEKARPIDMIMLANILRQKHGTKEKWAWQMCRLTGPVVQDSHMMHHCLALVEYRFRQRFAKALKIIKKDYPEQVPEMIDAILDLRNSLDVIWTAVQYAKQVGGLMAAALQEEMELAESVIKSIKKHQNLLKNEWI